jgi:hypothetical protein
MIISIENFMKIKKYSNAFAQAQAHPQAQQFYEESLARIRLAEAIHQERIVEKAND